MQRLPVTIPIFRTYELGCGNWARRTPAMQLSLSIKVMAHMDPIPPSPSFRAWRFVRACGYISYLSVIGGISKAIISSWWHHFRFRTMGTAGDHHIMVLAESTYRGQGGSLELLLTRPLPSPGQSRPGNSFVGCW